MNTLYKHLNLVRHPDGIVWLQLDKADASTNTLAREVLDELANVFAALEQTPPRGLVIASAKPAGFIAGADIDEFTRIGSATAARELVERGWSLFNWLARLPFPTLALIRGHCMGGGLELALACRYRIAVDEPGTRLALPEVMLGIMPAWGGMLRLPALIGPSAALDLMLTGRSVDARKAKKLGLVDECVPPRVMENAANMLVQSDRARSRPSLLERMLNGPLKPLVASKARQKLERKASRAHYPAPWAIIDIWAAFGGNALAVPADHPASLAAIFGSPTARNLIRVFQLQDRLKGFGKGVAFSPRHVHVVGAGVMGGDIAALCALRGLTVTLQDQGVARIAPAIARAAKLFERKHRGDARAQRFALDRLIADPDGSGVARADVIIEAISESLEAKHALFAGLEARARADALLATNTSSLRIEDIARVLENPARLVGIHFFNPVAQMPLVEVVAGEESDATALQHAAAFVRGLDKLALPVKSSSGFLVNAVLGPYMLEALRCVDEGSSPESIDAALLAFGMPMGPIELVDTVGLDIAVAAGAALAGDPQAEAPRELMSRFAAGQLGKKTGQGFYRWENGKPVRAQVTGAVAPDLAIRIIAPLVAAAKRLVEQGVVADADLADAGIIFGTGYAPFTGGPLHAHAGASPVPVGGSGVAVGDTVATR